ncbi:MAG: hypothetical protein ACLTFZ_03400 [Lachnospiraceae bacterium]
MDFQNPGIVIGVDDQRLGGIWKWEDENWTPTVGQSERRIYFEPLDMRIMKIQRWRR